MQVSHQVAQSTSAPPDRLSRPPLDDWLSSAGVDNYSDGTHPWLEGRHRLRIRCEFSAFSAEQYLARFLQVTRRGKRTMESKQNMCEKIERLHETAEVRKEGTTCEGKTGRGGMTRTRSTKARGLKKQAQNKSGSYFLREPRRAIPFAFCNLATSLRNASMTSTFSRMVVSRATMLDFLLARKARAEALFLSVGERERPLKSEELSVDWRRVTRNAPDLPLARGLECIVLWPRDAQLDQDVSDRRAVKEGNLSGQPGLSRVSRVSGGGRTLSRRLIEQYRPCPPRLDLRQMLPSRAPRPSPRTRRLRSRTWDVKEVERVEKV